MKEIWKTIEGWPYLVSNHGRIKRILDLKDIKPQVHYKGHLFLHLSREKEYKKFFVHRLVAMAFIPNPENKEFVDHIDENKQNNHVKNLQWKTLKENTQSYHENKKARIKSMNKFFKKAIHFKGKHYYGSQLPSEIPRGAVGDCFDHCLAVAMMFPEYQYVEGLAFINKRWIYHAWLAKDGISAFDPTWRAVDKDGKEVALSMVHYIGVKMDKKLVMEFVLATGYKAVLKNYWRKKDLAEKIYETAL